jgi:histidinol dehydrogenase
VIRHLDASAPEFESALVELLALSARDVHEVKGVVQEIIDDVKDRGDQALIELTNRFDGQSAITMDDLRIEPDRLAKAYKSIDPIVRDALDQSASRVREYHEKQLAALGSTSWQYTDELGNQLGQQVRGMQRVGLYAPGGKAAYPSTIIMTAIPARVAGVAELVLCVPTPGGEVNEVLLAAAHLSGVDYVFTVGGAQAIAAMAYGTDAVPAVDKIVGPGNVYVATAKELVFGDVGIDMVAGPSEVVIVADDTADPAWIVQDMFAQAEHDEMAQAILVSASDQLINKVSELLPVRLEAETRKDIIKASINGRGALIKVSNLAEAFSVVNRIAPEHLQLAIANPEQQLSNVKHAGAVFLGVDTAEVVGDYTAGPSHVLPTSGTARFASPLGVYDFQTRTSVIQCSTEGTIVLNRAAAILADVEGLDAHAESARSRVKG